MPIWSFSWNSFLPISIWVQSRRPASNVFQLHWKDITHTFPLPAHIYRKQFHIVYPSHLNVTSVCVNGLESEHKKALLFHSEMKTDSNGSYAMTRRADINAPASVCIVQWEIHHGVCLSVCYMDYKEMNHFINELYNVSTYLNIINAFMLMWICWSLLIASPMKPFAAVVDCMPSHAYMKCSSQQRQQQQSLTCTYNVTSHADIPARPQRSLFMVLSKGKKVMYLRHINMKTCFVLYRLARPSYV